MPRVEDISDIRVPLNVSIPYSLRVSIKEVEIATKELAAEEIISRKMTQSDIAEEALSDWLKTKGADILAKKKQLELQHRGGKG